MPLREKLLTAIEQMISTTELMKEELERDLAGSGGSSDTPSNESARARAAKRWGLGALIPVLGALGWALSRTRAEYAAAAGVVTLAAATSAVLLLTPRSPRYPDQGLPTIEPSMTGSLPATTIPVPTTTPTPSQETSVPTLPSLFATPTTPMPAPSVPTTTAAGTGGPAPTTSGRNSARSTGQTCPIHVEVDGVVAACLFLWRP